MTYIVVDIVSPCVLFLLYDMPFDRDRYKYRSSFRPGHARYIVCSFKLERRCLISGNDMAAFARLKSDEWMALDGTSCQHVSAGVVMMMTIADSSPGMR